MRTIKQSILRIMFRTIGVAFLAALGLSSVSSAQTWNTLSTPPTFYPSDALLLTDGTVLLHQYNSWDWWKLTPERHTTNYQRGTLARVASFPLSMNYIPVFFASAVLPDGRVIVEGGEYNGGVKDWTNLGAIYDPVANTWTQVDPPIDPLTMQPWLTIGDATSIVLPDGTFMLANCCDNPPEAALFDEGTLSWKTLTTLCSTCGYAGKFDENEEEGWTLLPNGNVLTVDTYWKIFDPTGMNYQIYNPTTQVWTSGPSTGTIVQLWDSRDGCTPKKQGNETGIALLRPDGTVFATGANTCPGAGGHTAIYDTVTETWAAGPDIPAANDMADAPAALLPDGRVLVETSPGYNKTPSTLYVFDGAVFHAIPQPTGLNPVTDFNGHMLVLPSGQILFISRTVEQIWFFTPGATYKAAWQPTICAGCYPSAVNVGGTYTVSGTQFNGLSQGSAYGDDSQNATNYPLVVLTNTQTGHKFFARTHGFSTMAVATGLTPVSTQFDVLAGTETGYSTLVVIANGIPSDPVEILVNP